MLQVCLHWPGEYANAARDQHQMSKPHVHFAKLNVAFETELAQRLGVGQTAHDFWHLYRGRYAREMCTCSSGHVCKPLLVYTPACTAPYALLWAPTVLLKAEDDIELLLCYFSACVGGEKVAEHSGERSKAAMLKFLAENSYGDLRPLSSSMSSEL